MRGRRKASRWSACRAITGKETVIAATQSGAGASSARPTRSTTCPVPARASSSSSCRSEDDRVLGFLASTGDRDIMRVETSRGAEQTISTDQIRGDRARRQGPGAAAARAVHPRHSERGRESGAVVRVINTGRSTVSSDIGPDGRCAGPAVRASPGGLRAAGRPNRLLILRTERPRTHIITARPKWRFRTTCREVLPSTAWCRLMNPLGVP